jgi:biopolymer transport protein ExbD
MEQLHTYEASDRPAPPVELDADEEQLVPPRKRAPVEGEIDFTPMIDMTFLLLIFFILTFKAEPPGGAKLPKAFYGRLALIRDSVILTVTEGGPDESVFIYKGDAASPDLRLQSTNPADQEEEIANYVRETMEQQNKHLVLIKASRLVRHRDVARVAEAIERVEEVKSLHVAVSEPQSQSKSPR